MKPTFIPKDKTAREAITAYHRDNPRTHPSTLTNGIAYERRFGEWLVEKLKHAQPGTTAAEDYATTLMLVFELIGSCASQLQCRMVFLDEITPAGEGARSPGAARK